MNNQLTSIAFSIYSNKGVYALILGSGISKTAGIPTGWDIINDLIKKLALLIKEPCKPDPETWFKTKFKEDPDYSIILSKIASTSSERINLLKPYIEPNPQEREQGLKVPTKAHIAIASLVKKGYIKLILTTNFDRLLENALQTLGIEPTVIRHANDIEGTIPLVHNDFTLIKINGDYLDSRFLNTKQELSKYEKKLHEYLLQIVNDYGIISCGWSGKWDTGLINILRECQNFRFGSFWTYKNDCEIELKEIAKKRKGQIVEINDADSFFTDVLERIEALESINENHPLNSDIALARLKKFIVKDEYKILLHDLILNEQFEAINKIKQIEDFSIYPDHKNLFPQLSKYEASVEILVKFAVNGVFWSKPEHNTIFQELIRRIAEPAADPPGKYYQETMNLHYYPSLLLFYSAGISALKGQKFEYLASIFKLKTAERKSENSVKFYLIKFTNAWLIQPDIMNKILNHNYKTPLSTYVNGILGPYFKDLITNEQDFNDLFDIFEYILCLQFIHLLERSGAPYGQFQWRRLSGYRTNGTLFQDFFSEGEIQKDNWPPIMAGLFGGKFETYQNIKNKLDKYLATIYLY